MCTFETFKKIMKSTGNKQRLCLIFLFTLFFGNSFGQGGVAPISLNPNPIPCGCITFDLEITIKPCDGMPSPPCEDKILETIYPFTLCCSCVIRKNDIPND